MVLLDLTLVVAEIILDRAVDSAEVSRHKARLQQEVAQAIAESLEHVVHSFSCESMMAHLETFLGYQDVQSEFGKLLLPYDSPRVDWLCQRWIGLYGSPTADLELVFKVFFQEANARLARIPELSGILNLRMTAQIKGSLDQELPSLRNGMTSLTAAVSDLAPPGNSVELRYDAQIDECRKLYQDNLPSTATAHLQKIEEELRGKDVSNRLRFRVQTLLGACALAQGNTEEATRRFSRAYQLLPGDAKAQANMALAHLLAGNPDEAVSMAELSLAKEQTGTNARAVRTLALAAVRGYQELDGLVDENHFDDAGYVRALGQVFLEARQYEQAAEHLRLCSAQDAGDGWSRLLLVDALFAMAVPALEVGLAVSPGRPRDATLLEAASLADDVVLLAKRGDNTVLRHQALVARARVKAAVGDRQGAKADLEEVLRDDENSEPALYNLALLSAENQDPAGALSFFERVPEGHRPYAAWQSMVFCYLTTGRLPEARNALERARQLGGDTYLRFQEAWLLIKEGHLVEATAIQRELAALDQPSALGVAALVSRMLGDQEGELELLAKAYEAASAPEKERRAAELALVHFERKQYPEAILWLERCGERRHDDVRLLRAYVGSLFFSGQYEHAHDEAERARKGGTQDPALLHTQAWIAEAVGDVQLALEVYRTLQQLEPANGLHTVGVLRCACLLGDTEGARVILRTMELRDLGDPVALAQVAEVMDVIGDHEQAVRTAYRALRSGGTVPQIHLSYLRLLVANEHRIGNLSPCEVGVGTAVRVRSGERGFWIKILDDAQPQAQWEITADSPLAGRLIGCQVGDTVTVRKDSLQELSYEVVEIQSLLVRAAQESADAFGTLFPDNLLLQKGEVRDGDVAPMLMTIARLGFRSQEWLDRYNDGYLTLEMLATLVGHHRYDVQRGFYGGDAKYGLLCSSGSPEAQAKEQAAADQATSVTVDLSALITLQQLGLLDTLAKRFSPIHVPQQLLSELVLETADRRGWKGRARHSIGFHDGRWQLVEVPQEVLDDEARRLDELLCFVRDRCNVVPITIGGAILIADPRGPAKVVGQSTLATMLVAKQTRSPLYADDLALHTIAEEMGCSSGFWTVPLLANMAERGLITNEQHQDACIQLILANHRYVPVSGQILFRVITSGQATDRKTRKVVDMLRGPATTEGTAIAVAADLLKAVYMDSGLQGRRTFILHAVLGSLVVSRMPEKVLLLLERQLKTIMHPRSAQLALIRRDIRDWRAVVAPTVIPRSLGGQQ